MLLDTGFFQTDSPQLGDRGDDGLWLGAGGSEPGLIET